jgi:3'-5' exoribonuclease
MKSPYAGELVPNQTITTSFLVHVKEIRQKKGGEFYLSLLLGDRTGDVDAKMWDNVNDVLDVFERDDFVKVKGLVQIFHNRPQLTIHKLRRMEESEVDFADYFPASKRDPEEMWRELQGIVAEIGNPHLKALLNAMFADEDIAQRYRRAPAAKQIHHAFLGGLLEHVLSVCAMAKPAAAHYANIDRDLLLTGVLLHDIGKIYELSYERGFSYSSEGQLIGHIAIASRMLHEKLRGLPGFPPKLRAMVEHLILSHHGQLEFGSPKLPSFPEALLLHYLDDLDSKMECMRALIEKDPYVEGCFTGYSGVLDRVVLKKERYLNPPPPAPKPSPQPRPSPVAVAAAPAVDAEPETAAEPIPSRIPMAEHPLFAPKPAPPLSDPRSSATHEESRLKSGSGQDCPPHGRQELQPAGPQKES